MIGRLRQGCVGRGVVVARAKAVAAINLTIVAQLLPSSMYDIEDIDIGFHITYACV
jgi:hypothetical protein